MGARKKNRRRCAEWRTRPPWGMYSVLVTPDGSRESRYAVVAGGDVIDRVTARTVRRENTQAARKYVRSAPLVSVARLHAMAGRAGLIAPPRPRPLPSPLTRAGRPDWTAHSQTACLPDVSGWRFLARGTP